MKLWFSPTDVKPGKNYGSTLLIKKMAEAVTQAGATLCFDPQEDFDVAMHFARPDRFQPIPGRKNILYTACESTPLLTWFRTDEAMKAVNQAVALVVPSHFCRRQFAKYYPRIPLHVVPEGVDAQAFPFYQRSEPGPGEPFRFLFCGTLDGRKGHDICLRAFVEWQRRRDAPRNVSLRIKTTAKDIAIDGEKLDGVRSYPESGKPPAIIWDNRNLPTADLAQLYNSAHCFLLPSRGEGWGQMLTDAMSTGCPSIWTAWSAMLDYADKSVGFPITKYRMMPSPDPAFGNYADISLDALIERMEHVYSNYGRALELGRRASERMRNEYTWTLAGEKLLAVLRRFM